MADFKATWNLVTRGSPNPDVTSVRPVACSLRENSGHQPLNVTRTDNNFATDYELSRCNVARNPEAFERNLTFLMNALG